LFNDILNCIFFTLLRGITTEKCKLLLFDLSQKGRSRNSIHRFSCNNEWTEENCSDEISELCKNNRQRDAFLIDSRELLLSFRVVNATSLESIGN
jgi:hypothetical protein